MKNICAAVTLNFSMCFVNSVLLMQYSKIYVCSATALDPRAISLRTGLISVLNLRLGQWQKVSQGMWMIKERCCVSKIRTIFTDRWGKYHSPLPRVSFSMSSPTDRTRKVII
ncbi:hypothetical protein TNIN_457301 [Trichonephila inaurata madagascariensis]|uniref:Secreted protein n=1 Tax=Trichonephila inaurata madagascariensis TaxID=2747483 RepID=A0A8X6X4S5_9ARAC|nr:hypothetical protein TNIN_457301 [Trichonephila inaurata madagascariensis]